MILALLGATGVAAGSANQRVLARPIYTGGGLNAVTQPRPTNCGGYVVTRVRYSGILTTPHSRLDGRVTLAMRFVTDAARRNGFATGQLEIRSGRRLKAKGNLRAVISQGVNVNGILTGRLMRPRGLLIANVSLLLVGTNYIGAQLNVGLSQTRNSAVAYSPLPKC